MIMYKYLLIDTENIKGGRVLDRSRFDIFDKKESRIELIILLFDRKPNLCSFIIP